MVRKADMPIQRLTPEIITAAILGFEEQKRHIDTKIGELRAMLPGGPAETAATPKLQHVGERNSPLPPESA
jgi:hypothetical protein